jgi:hypothetical protein
MLRRAAAALLFAVGLVALCGPAHGETRTPAHTEDTSHDRTQPPPAPGAHRLVRLGPQALVFEDDRGNISMVDEPGEGITKGQAIGTIAGAVGGGVAGVILAEPRGIAFGAVYGAGEPAGEDETPASLTEQRRLSNQKAPTPPPRGAAPTR